MVDQQKADSLSSQFQALAQDFRGIDPAGGYQRVMDLAGYGAKLCKKAYAAGLLDLTRYKRGVALLTEWRSSGQDDLASWIRELLVKEFGEMPDQPIDALNKLAEKRLDERKMWPSMDTVDMWAGTWKSIVSDLSSDHLDELPCNLFVDNPYFAFFGVEAPRTAKTEWRSLAQNYAMVANWLAEHILKNISGDDTPDFSSATKHGKFYEFCWEQGLREGCSAAAMRSVITEWKKKYGTKTDADHKLKYRTLPDARACRKGYLEALAVR